MVNVFLVVYAIFMMFIIIYSILKESDDKW